MVWHGIIGTSCSIKENMLTFTSVTRTPEQTPCPNTDPVPDPVPDPTPSPIPLYFTPLCTIPSIRLIPESICAALDAVVRRRDTIARSISEDMRAVSRM